jgi:hypothetical protein
MIEESKGEAVDGVQHETRSMSDEEVAEVQEWLDNLRALRK